MVVRYKLFENLDRYIVIVLNFLRHLYECYWISACDQHKNKMLNKNIKNDRTAFLPI